MRLRIAFFIEPALSDVIPRLRYLCDWLNAHPLCVEADVHWAINAEEAPHRIYYGSAPAPAEYLRMVPDYPLIRVSPPCRQPYGLQPFEWNDTVLYGVVAQKTNVCQVFFQEKNFAFDWLGTLFFLLSRVEEYNPTQVDDIGGSAERGHVLVREEKTLTPIADRLVAALVTIFTGKAPLRKSPIQVSHDVDALRFFGAGFQGLRYGAGSALRWKTLRHWPALLRDYWAVKGGRKTDPGDIFDTLLAVQPGFIFWGVGQTTPQDQFPDWEKEPMPSLRALADQCGYTFGLHPGFGTWKNEALFAEEKQTLEKQLASPIAHSRQHFLRFAFPETADILENQQIKMDFSIGYRYHIGFRAGTGFPFSPYHFKEQRPYRWKAVPLALMDVAFLRHAGYNVEKARALWTHFFETNAWNTALHLNMHNTGFYEPALMGLPMYEWYTLLLHWNKGTVKLDFNTPVKE